jgi:predicted acyl esterase
VTGYGYLETRDGTTLSVQVVLPGPADEGPYPTVVEYSGYDPSSTSTGQPQFKLLMPELGFAWVGVNIRGTGCSGGAFNYFENLQSLDGYDVIETVAAQGWSTGQVGMVGISYAGISQLFVARTRPPHLAAITPVSVIADTWRGMLYPGGIKNDGFALSWASQRVEQNKWPNPSAPAWVKTRINGGDTTCADNMLLRGQNVDLLHQIDSHPNPSPMIDPEFTYDFPLGSDSLAPAEFIDQITAKVFIAGAWQDEQTGGHWATMLDRFADDTFVRVVGQNGTHIESLDPWVAHEAIEFVQLYVAQQTPEIPVGLRAVAPILWSTIAGVNGMNFPPDRFTGMTYEQARAAFEAEPPLRILWETGNATGFGPGTLIPRAESRFASWPIPQVEPQAWYFREGGRLRRQSPRDWEVGDSEYAPDQTLRPRENFGSGNIWSANPTYQWLPIVDGASLAFLSDPLAKPISMAGTASVDLWVSSNVTDNDVQVTLSEVLPGGTQERYVQTGWLRLSHRKVDKDLSTPLNPVHTDYVEDMKPMPIGKFMKARVALFPFAHQFREGSRIRITIQAPGGDRPEWTFDTADTGGDVVNRIGHSVKYPSRVVLPVLSDGPDLGENAAACPSIRAQPCRGYVEPGSEG